MLSAVADTCFLIDWARFRRRDLLTKLFNKIVVTQHILDEVRSNYTIEYIASLIASDKLLVYPITPSVERFVMDLVSFALRDPRIPRVDEPELYALAIGYLLKLPVLTENRGAIRLAQLHPELVNLEIYGALEILEKAIADKLVNVDSCLELFMEYTNDTKHSFPKRRLNKVLERLRNNGYCR